jgi:hypothetical protein
MLVCVPVAVVKLVCVVLVADRLVRVDAVFEVRLVPEVEEILVAV